MTCPHGLEFSCKHCHKEARAQARADVKAGTWVYCVFVWKREGMYRVEDAVEGKRYKLQIAAQRYADRLNETVPVHCRPGGYVVRLVPNRIKETA